MRGDERRWGGAEHVQETRFTYMPLYGANRLEMAKGYTDFYNGMVVSVPLLTRLLNKKMTAKEVQKLLASYYASERFVRVMPFESEAYLENRYFNATECNNTNRIDLFVFGHDEQISPVRRRAWNI